MRPTLISAVLGLAFAAAAGVSIAAESTSASSGQIPVAGTVGTFCTIGAPADGNYLFDLGVMTDTTTGLLKSNLGPVSKTLQGATCNVQSAISVNAESMTPSQFSGAAPTGFSASVDYVATASGWTTAPASYDTAQSSHPLANQSRNSPFTGPITVTLSGFNTTGGQNLRLVSDPEYAGVIKVILTAQ